MQSCWLDKKTTLDSTIKWLISVWFSPASARDCRPRATTPAHPRTSLLLARRCCDTIDGRCASRIFSKFFEFLRKCVSALSARASRLSTYNDTKAYNYILPLSLSALRTYSSVLEQSVMNSKNHDRHGHGRALQLPNARPSKGNALLQLANTNTLRCTSDSVSRGVHG